MPDYSHELKLGRDQGKIICGIDEVGRGPLAGVVVAAAVIIPQDFSNDISAQIKDSKKMSAAQRQRLFPILVAHCPYAVAQATVQEIDKLNILQASLLAMQRAFEDLQHQCGVVIDAALVDGNKLPKLPCNALAVVGGDDRSYSIAAASIIAKVTRDRMMQNDAAAYPGYGWERNAGYGTKQHLDAIERLGITPLHRRSFAPVARLLPKIA